MEDLMRQYMVEVSRVLAEVIAGRGSDGDGARLSDLSTRLVRGVMARCPVGGSTVACFAGVTEDGKFSRVITGEQAGADEIIRFRPMFVAEVPREGGVDSLRAVLALSDKMASEMNLPAAVAASLCVYKGFVSTLRGVTIAWEAPA